MLLFLAVFQVVNNETLGNLCLLLQVEMLRKGLKEIGILKDGRSSLYHHLNPTSIGFFMLP